MIYLFINIELKVEDKIEIDPGMKMATE